MFRFYKPIAITLAVAILFQPLSEYIQNLNRINDFRKEWIRSNMSEMLTNNHFVQPLSSSSLASFVENSTDDPNENHDTFDSVENKLLGTLTSIYLPLVVSGANSDASDQSYQAVRENQYPVEEVSTSESNSLLPLVADNVESGSLDSGSETNTENTPKDEPSQPLANAIYLPLVASGITTNPSVPADFAITYPHNGETVSGPFYILAQQTGPIAVSEVTFSAGGQVLGSDNSPNDGFHIVADTQTFFQQSISLSASAKMADGSTRTHSILLTVESSPSNSKTISQSGGVLQTASGNIVTIPANSVNGNATVSVSDITEEQIKSATGIDFSGNGLNLLGAYKISSSQSLQQDIQSAIPVNANAPGAGDSIVNFTILPDLDGDGIGEMVATGSGELHGNRISSTPTLKPAVKSYGVDSGLRSAAMLPAGSTITAMPGEMIRVEAEGFNAFALQGTRVIFNASDGTSFETIVSPPQHRDLSPSQNIIIAVPDLPIGSATIELEDVESGNRSSPIALDVVATPTLKEPAVDITLRVLGKLQKAIELDSLRTASQSPVQVAGIDIDAAVKTGLLSLQDEISRISASPTATETEQLETMAHLFVNSNFDSKLDNIVNQLAQSRSSSSGTWQIVDLVAALASLILGVVLFAIDLVALSVIAILLSFYGFIRALINLNDIYPRNIPPCPCNCIGNTNGSTSKQQTGGSGTGSVQSSGSASLSAAGALARQYVVHVYVDGKRLPFSGVTDKSGYFSLPEIPAGKPFLAIATDTQTNETRGVRGVGPAIGDMVFIYFDFTTADQIISTPIAWTGGGDGKSWSEAANWDLNRIPQSSDMVNINVPGTPTILIDKNTEVYSIQSEENIAFKFGSDLTLVASSRISGSLTMDSGSYLTADGALAEVTVIGKANLDGGSLVAHDGGRISIPNVTSFTNVATNNDSIIQAVGKNSAVNLPNLQNTTSVSSCDAFFGCEGNIKFEATYGGVISVDKLAQVVGQSYSFLASGGSVMSFPSISSVANQAGYDILFQSDGAASTIQMPNLQSVAAATQCAAFFGCAGQVEFDALNGGNISLNSVSQVSGQTFIFLARGNGSVLDLSSLQTVTSDSPHGIFGVNDTSVINAPQLTQMNQTDLIVVRGGLFPAKQLTQFTDATFLANDKANVKFDSIQDIDLLNIRSEGGSKVVMPISRYVGTTKEKKVSISATGVGSLLDMSSVMQLIGQDTISTELLVSANDGGKIDLSGVRDIPGGGVIFESKGLDSIIDLSQLVTHRRTGYYVLEAAYQAIDGGTILTPSLLELIEIDVTVDVTSTMTTKQIQSMREGSITVLGGSIDLSSLNDPTGNSFYAKSGGRLTLPANVNTYVGTDKVLQSAFQALGKGSVIDFGSLTSVAGNTFTGTALKVEAKDGGFVNLENVAAIVRGNVTVTADGATSKVDLTNLLSIQGSPRIESNLLAQNGGAVVVPNLKTIRNAGVKLNNNGTIDTAQLETMTDGYVDSDRRNVEFLGLSNIDGSGFTARNGSALSFPKIVAYTGGSTTTMLFHKGFYATGFGSSLKFPKLATANGATFTNVSLPIKAEQGGLVEMPLLKSISNGNTKIDVIGTQSHVNLGSLSSFSKSTRGDSYIEVQSNAKLTLASTTILTDVNVTFQSNAVLSLGKLEFRGTSALTANGALQSSLVNQGVVSNGSAISSLAINGNYTQSQVGRLEVDIRDTNPTVGYDRYNVIGKASLDGNLVLRFTNGITPKLGDKYVVLSAGTVTGNFASTKTENLSPSLATQVVTTGNSVTVEIISAN